MNTRAGARHAARRKIPALAVILMLAILAGGAGAGWRLSRKEAAAPSPSAAGSASASPSVEVSPAPSPSPGPVEPGPIDPDFPGLTTFRGNLTRSYYGMGPVPDDPVIRWRYPAGGTLCSISSDNHGSREWCGTGWTGQPNVIPGRHGSVEVRIGAYDANYHFLDGKTGEQVRPDLVTGDLAKGSATSDPNGYPLYYAGSRDNLFRIVALDRAEPTVLWSMDADSTVSDPTWNNDWDGAAAIVDDYMLVGGENSWFYVVRLNRGYDSRGMVTVRPKIVMRVPGYDQELIDTIGDTDVSIEGSVAFYDGVAYFGNSGGLVQGWDISNILAGGKRYERVFRFWNGDDTDATITIDEEGFLYVGRKMQDNTDRPESFQRDHEIGSLMKLDPSRPKHPLVWSVQLGGFERDGGLLGTPALSEGIVYAMITEGAVSAVDAETGEILWTKDLVGPTWSSPVVVDGRLIVGEGNGYLNCFDVHRPGKDPGEPLWRLNLGGNIESTPAVWNGWIYVGTRYGQILGIADKHTK